jgi:small subunit ribosomal protein S17
METKRKVRFGRVIGDKMDKTVIVAVDTPRRHPLYKKTIRRIVKYYAHDEENKSKMGDTVKIEETRPLSKLKRWRVVEIVTKGEVADIKPEEITN